MRALLRCDEHGFAWAEGDEPCQACAKRAALRNSRTRREPKTKLGRVWPEDIHTKSERGTN